MNSTILQDARKRNELWFAQRETCLSCSNCLTRSGTTGETIMNCAEVAGKGSQWGAHCIDAREPGQRCGPDATLFQPKE